MPYVDPSIALNVKPLQLPDPLAQYGKMVSIQSAQQQNALAQYQLEAARREEASINALNQAYQSAYNPETGKIDVNRLRGALATGGFGSKIAGVEKTLGELEKLELERKELQGKVTAQPTALETAKAALVDAKLKQSRQFLDTIDPADPNAPEMYMKWHEANHADPVLGPLLAARGVTAEQSRSRIAQAIAQGPAAFAQLLMQSKLGAEKFIEQNAPKFLTQDVGGQTRVVSMPGLGGPATVVPGSVATKTLAPGEPERLNLERQRVGLEARRVAAQEEDQRRAADPQFQQRIAGAKATGELLAKGGVAAQQALPVVTDRAERGLRLIDELVGKPEIKDAKGNVIQAATAPHPGFENVVGAGLPFRFVPGTAEASFQSRFDEIKGGSFLEAFESLKGGGAITEKEGEKATSAINRMNISQSEDEFIAAARDLQDIMRKGLARAKAKAGGGGAAAPAPAATSAAGPKAAPAVGTVQDGYRFKGGNPADAKNWEKL